MTTQQLAHGWTAEQRKALTALKRSNAYPAVSSRIEAYPAPTFADVWYAVAYETDFAEIDREEYMDLPEDQRWTDRAYRYAVKWRDRYARLKARD